MKKIIVLVALGFICGSPLALSQTHTQHISFDDGVGPGNAGTYSPSDHFSVDLYLTFSGYSSPGFSLWFDTSPDAAPFITISGFTFGATFSLFNPFVTFPLVFSVPQSNGFFTTPNVSDLGGLTANNGAVPAGTYFAGTLALNLNGLPPGTYILETDGTSPHRTEVADCHDGNCFDNPVPSAAYTITIIPEPSTIALVSFALFAGSVRRASRRHR